jgi:hypothetical protein
LCGRRFCQSAGISRAFGELVDVVGQRQRHHVGVSRPSITERACLPEPPWLCLTVTTSPVFFCQWAAKALLNST